MPFAVLRAKQYKCESLEILEAFFLTLAGATVASVWDDIFHHPDDETVLDDTLACVRWMYSERDGLSGCKKDHMTWPSTYICCGYHPMTGRAPTTRRLSGRRYVRFIASSARKGGHLMWPPSCAGLFEILRKHPLCRGSRVPVYESDVLSNSLKSFGLPLPRLAFMHWPTKKPMTFWLPSRYCCA